MIYYDVVTSVERYDDPWFDIYYYTIREEYYQKHHLNYSWIVCFLGNRQFRVVLSKGDTTVEGVPPGWQRPFSTYEEAALDAERMENALELTLSHLLNEFIDGEEQINNWIMYNNWVYYCKIQRLDNFKRARAERIKRDLRMGCEIVRRNAEESGRYLPNSIVREIHSYLY